MFVSALPVFLHLILTTGGETEVYGGYLTYLISQHILSGRAVSGPRLLTNILSNFQACLLVAASCGLARFLCRALPVLRSPTQPSH